MFESLQILWWLIEATLFGYLFTRKVIQDTTNQILFAPLFGFAFVVLLGNFLWMWGVSTLFSRYLFAIGIGFGLYSFIKTPLKIANKELLIGGLFCALLLIAQSILIPYSEKVFQAYPLDKFFYTSGGILFEQENINYFINGVKRFTEHHDISAYIIHPLFAEALSVIHGRPAAELSYVIFSWATPRDLYRLGHAWETFSRVLQFFGILAIFWNLGCKKFGALFLSLGLALSFWFQYTKDFNAWSSSFTLALTIGSAGFLIYLLNQKKISLLDSFAIGILVLAGLIHYPELGAPSTIGIAIAIICNKKLRGLFVSPKIFLLEVALFTLAMFAVYPSILDWINRQLTLSPIMVGGEEHQGRNLFRLFDGIAERGDFISQVIKKPLRFFLDPAGPSDMLIGITGFPYISYVGAPLLMVVILVLSLYLIYQLISTKSLDEVYRGHKKQLMVSALLWVGFVSIPVMMLTLKSKLYFGNSAPINPNTVNTHLVNFYNSIGVGHQFDFLTSLLIGSLLLLVFLIARLSTPNKSLQPLINLALFFAALFFGCQAFNSLGGTSRTIPYWGVFASTALIATLYFSQIKVFKQLCIGLVLTHFVFGLSIFYTARTPDGMESYPIWYSNSTSVRHTEIDKAKHKYDYDYSHLTEELKRCKAVYINMPSEDTRASRFHEMNLIFFLENNHIPAYLEMPYRNASLLIGNPIFEGYKNSQGVITDCEINEEMRNGKIGYKLIRR